MTDQELDLRSEADEDERLDILLQEYQIRLAQLERSQKLDMIYDNVNASEQFSKVLNEYFKNSTIQSKIGDTWITNTQLKILIDDICIENNLEA